MPPFVGRTQELDTLNKLARDVQRSGEGRLLAVRGRRQVGKSTLLEELLRMCGAPSAFFTATFGATPEAELQSFTAEIGSSTLEAAELFAAVRFESWQAALRELAAAVTRPSVLVIDELPYLAADFPSLEGILQVAWDRWLSRKPLLVVLVGSDLRMMEFLSAYGRPLYGRTRELVVGPLTVADTSTLLDLAPADAFDAHLVTGGFPRIATEWRRGSKLASFVREQLRDALSPLVVVGERILNSEFPRGTQARDVLTVVGSGETGFTRIRDRAGINEGSLTRTLRLLESKRVTVTLRPLADAPARGSLYLVADPYLRFWLRFIAPHLELVLRGRGDVVARRTIEAWADYRGKAVEHLIRESIARLLPDARFGRALHVGAWWSRTGEAQVDLVGASAPTPPAPVSFVGSIKWRERMPFGSKDLASLAAVRERVPGAADALLVGVSRSGFATTELDVMLGPDDLVDAWRRPAAETRTP